MTTYNIQISGMLKIEAKDEDEAFNKAYRIVASEPFKYITFIGEGEK